jgi:acetyltransferase
VRGRDAIDLEKLEQLLVRFSQLIVEQPQICEIDINPLLVSPQGAIALDARVVLHSPENTILPAIRPYPVQYVQEWSTLGDLPITIRPIRPEDKPLMVRFHEELSEETVYLRYRSHGKVKAPHRSRTFDADLFY